MSSDLQLFNFEGHDVRAMVINNQPRFIGQDVAVILGYSEPRRAVYQHVDQEDRQSLSRKDWGDLVPTLWPNPNDWTNKTVIDESGVYSLIFSSHMPNAKKFKHWVTSEVLPSIRKHGAYMTPKTVDKILSDPDTIIKLATNFKNEREKRMKAESKVKELAPSADYARRVLNSKGVQKMSIFAKNYGLSAETMNRGLHKLHVIFKQGKDWFVYQDPKHPERASWSYHIQHPFNHKDGRPDSQSCIRWRQTGFKGLHDVLAEHGILPTLERDENDYKTFDHSGNIIRVWNPLVKED